MNKIIEIIKKNAVELGFAVVGLLLVFLPVPLPIRTFGLGLEFATVLNPLIKHIIESNTKS